jgi:hypothetical protein
MLRLLLVPFLAALALRAPTVVAPEAAPAVKAAPCPQKVGPYATYRDALDASRVYQMIGYPNSAPLPIDGVWYVCLRT